MSEKPIRLPPSTNPHFRRIEFLAYILDGYIAVPGTSFKIGLDPIIGLLPGVGDIVGGCASLYLVYLAARAGLPPTALVLMIGNVIVDVVIGAIPVLGDIFDFTWKVNARNLAIVDRHRARNMEPIPRSIRKISALALVLIVGVLVVFLAALVLLVWMLVSMFR